MERTKETMTKSRKVLSYAAFTICLFAALIMLVYATSILWIGEREIAKVLAAPDARETSTTSNYYTKYMALNYYPSRVYGLGYIFITLLVIIPGAVGIPTLDTILGSGRFIRALLLGPIWTILVIAVAWLKFRPLHGVLLLGAAVAFAFAALVFLYKEGEKRMNEEKDMLRLSDNFIRQVKEGKSIDEIDFDEDDYYIKKP